MTNTKNPPKPPMPKPPQPIKNDQEYIVTNSRDKLPKK
jgi:hypothetical protein